jgi:hypothetical protein
MPGMMGNVRKKWDHAAKSGRARDVNFQLAKISVAFDISSLAAGARGEIEMTGIALLRGTLLTASTVLGGSGVFLLYYSFMSAPLGDYGVVCLALASAIAWFVDRSAANTMARPRR